MGAEAPRPCRGFECDEREALRTGRSERTLDPNGVYSVREFANKARMFGASTLTACSSSSMEGDKGTGEGEVTPVTPLGWEYKPLELPDFWWHC